MVVKGNYVKSFAEASHALPQGMYMDADYPLKLARISRIENGKIFLESTFKEYSADIKKKNGQEYCRIAQSSSFEHLFNRKPTMFTFLPFKDESTEASGPRPPGRECWCCGSTAAFCPCSTVLCVVCGDKCTNCCTNLKHIREQ